MMARIRSIKPEFFQSKKLSQCSAEARLLAIGLLQLCDSNGRFLHIPMQIHAHVFPWEAEVNSLALLKELESIGYVFFYEIEGKEYGCIPGFKKHQRLTGKEAQSSGIYPEPNQELTDSFPPGGSNGEIPGKHLDAQEQGTGNREQGTVAGRAKRSSQISKDFQPNESCQRKAEALGVNLDAELEKFFNHAQANGRTAKDWQAAFRNWLIKAAEFQGGKAQQEHDPFAGALGYEK